MAVLKELENNTLEAALGIDLSKKLSKEEKKRFRVAPDGWTSSSSSDSEAFVAKPEKKTRRLRLGVKKRVGSENSRFQLAKSETLDKMAKPYMPKNTEMNKWAVNNLKEWWIWHNRQEGAEECPEEILSSECSAEMLNTWLAVYAVETRSKDGKSYSPTTIYSLLTGILRSMTVKNPLYPNFLKQKDPRFVLLHRTLDNHFRDLREQGVGADSKRTPTITIEEEQVLWDKKILNPDTPRGLFRAVFYYNGKNFVLRGGQEHRDLMLSQVVRMKDPERYEYIENSSKNRAGGMAQLRLSHKKVPIYANPIVGERCHVFLLDKYFSKLPKCSKEKGFFYWKPLATLPGDPTAPWFGVTPVGRNVLAKVVSEMFQEAGVSERKTNHSLRAAGVSQLFEAGVDEKVIQNRSGHRSIDALRMYENVTPVQQQAVSNILTSGQKKNYRDEVKLVSESSEFSHADSPPVDSTPLPVDSTHSDSGAALMPVNLPGRGVDPYVQQLPSASFQRPFLLPGSRQTNANIPTLSGMQCYGCSINFYQGPVVVNHQKDTDMSKQEMKQFLDF